MGLPENIDALLVKFDINQDQLARVADVSPSSVTRWRKGSQMRPTQLRRICDYFDLSEDDLLSTDAGLAAKEHGRYGIEYMGSGDERELLVLFRSMDAGERAALLGVARAMGRE